MASVQHRMYRKNGVLYNYDNDDIFCRGDIPYFDCSISQCVLDSEVLGLYDALCNSPSVIQTCSCLVVPNDPFGCKPVIDESKCSSICLQINQAYSASYTMIQSNSNNIQSLFRVFIQPDGNPQSQMSGVERFNATYNSLQTLRVYSADPVAGVYYPFNFALYELPLAQCINPYTLAGLVSARRRPESNAISLRRTRLFWFQSPMSRPTISILI